MLLLGVAHGAMLNYHKLERHALDKAVRAHCTKEHPKRDIKTLKKARWQARDPVLQARRDKANKKLIATKKAIRDTKSNGHTLTSVKVNWTEWPHKAAKKTRFSWKTTTSHKKKPKCKLAYLCRMLAFRVF